MKKTKIITTIGPASENSECIAGLYDAGANIIRFNFSHANYENVKRLKGIIDSLNAAGRTNLSSLLDTKGPEIRTTDVKEKLKFKKGDIVKIFDDKVKYTDDGASILCDYSFLVEDLVIGDIIEIDSGLLKTVVKNCKSDYLEIEILNDCEIGSRRHINLPGKKIKLPGITPKDEEDVLFAIENNFDFIAQSFVRTAANVLELRQILKKHDASHIKIISKIENSEGIENLDEIIAVSDGIMVARGDLGIETPIEMLPIYQRQMVKKCLESGKFVIIATQLLESMMENPFPTRAEVSDVFNSVMQKTDCLMLSGETAAGKYPIETVRTMTNVINEAEKQMHYKHQDFSIFGLSGRDVEKKALIRGSLFLLDELSADALVIFTKTGLLARLAASFRPNKDVYAFTGKTSSLNYMNILFGIKPYKLADWSNVYKENLKNAISKLIADKKLCKDSKIVVITDLQKDTIEIPVLEIINIGDFIEAYGK